MAALTITDLFTPLTAAEWRAKLVTELLVLQVPADKWRAGGVASTMLTACSIILELLCGALVTIIQGFFLPKATGLGLRLLAYYVYGVTVTEATFATGSVTLTNTGGGAYSKAIGEYTALNPSNGQTYTNTASFSVGAVGSLTAVVSVTMRAVNAGSVGNAVPDAISESSTALTGVAVTNPASFVGTDAPTDEAIRQLCLNSLASASVRGVRTVYAYAIQTATNSATNGSVNINRWAISEGSHTGTVTLIVAAPSGPVDPDDLIAVQTSLEAKARPSGVNATAFEADGVTYAPNVTIWVNPLGAAQTDIQDAVDTAISTYIAAFPIGGVVANDDDVTNFRGLFRGGINGAIATGCASVGASLLSVRGLEDLALDSTDVAEDSVTVNVILVASNNGVLS